MPAWTQQLVSGEHCTFWMQVLDGSAQLPLAQAGNGGSQHLERLLGQERVVHCSDVLQASLGPQG